MNPRFDILEVRTKLKWTIFFALVFHFLLLSKGSNHLSLLSTHFINWILIAITTELNLWFWSFLQQLSSSQVILPFSRIDFIILSISWLSILLVNCFFPTTLKQQYWLLRMQWQGPFGMSDEMFLVMVSLNRMWSKVRYKPYWSMAA